MLLLQIANVATVRANAVTAASVWRRARPTVTVIRARAHIAKDANKKYCRFRRSVIINVISVLSCETDFR